MDKKRKDGLGTGAKTGLITVTFIRGMTSSLDETIILTTLGKRIEDIMGTRKSF
ncbi:MAG: hypothetical protein Q4D53_05155 [Leptotrichiaceae bacterium]|nr:hypothetical protein [Leptotrichiaceae bacterium]